MIEAVAFAYSLMATFILCSAERNRRSARGHAIAIERFGLVLMGFSFTAALLMFAWAGALWYLR